MSDEIRERLTSATERLNGALALAEHKICDLQLGVHGKVVLSDGVAELHFGKVTRGWCLTVVLQPDLEDPDHIPLLAAPRRVRVEAAARLDDLVADLRARALQMAEDVEKATDAATAWSPK